MSVIAILRQLPSRWELTYLHPRIEENVAMGLPVLSSLLVAIVLFGFAAHPLQSAAQEYGDSPRPSPISRLHMTESLSGKHLLTTVEPDYPPEAKSKGIEGDVTFRIIIGKDGTVREIHLRRGKYMGLATGSKRPRRPGGSIYL
jgi:hypothetical protein